MKTIFILTNIFWQVKIENDFQIGIFAEPGGNIERDESQISDKAEGRNINLFGINEWEPCHGP